MANEVLPKDKRPHLETERLILRVPALADLDRWAEMMEDEESARFLGGAMPKPVVWRQIMQLIGAWAVTGISMFSVVEKASGKWIGRVGPWHPFAWPGTEVGWGLHPDARGKGYAVEAAAASLDYAFDVLQWTTVIHLVHPDNTRSRRVAERLGATLRGRTNMPAPYATEVADIWGQSRDEWRARTAKGATTTARLP